MSLAITLLYGSTSVLLAAFGVWELRMLAQFLRNRAVILGEARTKEGPGSPDTGRAVPRVTIQIPLFNERTADSSSWQ